MRTQGQGHLHSNGPSPRAAVGPQEGRDGAASSLWLTSHTPVSKKSLRSEGRWRSPPEEDPSAGPRGPWVSFSCAPEGLTFLPERAGEPPCSWWGTRPGGGAQKGTSSSPRGRGPHRAREGRGRGLHRERASPGTSSPASTAPGSEPAAQLCPSAADLVAAQWVLDSRRGTGGNQGSCARRDGRCPACF